MTQLGTHVLIDVFGCDFSEINNKKFIKKLMIDAAKVSGAKIEKFSAKKFKPQGLTVLILVSESHLSFHSYPENRMCMLDIFTCGNRAVPEKGAQYILSHLKHDKHSYKVITRG